ncbi:MAG: hypothetical protein N2C14_31365, partial [Planctomycetales bacterium]
VLDRSVDGRLLTTIYLDTRRSLTLANQGGARVKVKEVEFVSCRVEPLEGDAGFVAACAWNVSGSVGHWGHTHQRINQYHAELVIQPVDGQWKIRDMTLMDEKRLY